MGKKKCRQRLRVLRLTNSSLISRSMLRSSLFLFSIHLDCNSICIHRARLDLPDWTGFTCRQKGWFLTDRSISSVCDNLCFTCKKFSSDLTLIIEFLPIAEWTNSREPIIYLVLSVDHSRIESDQKCHCDWKLWVLWKYEGIHCETNEVQNNLQKHLK